MIDNTLLILALPPLAGGVTFLVVGIRMLLKKDKATRTGGKILIVFGILLLIAAGALVFIATALSALR